MQQVYTGMAFLMTSVARLTFRSTVSPRCLFNDELSQARICAEMYITLYAQHPEIIFPFYITSCINGYSIPFWLYRPLVGLYRFFSFLIYTQAVGLLGWGIRPSQGLYLHTEQHKDRKKRTQTSMPRVELEPTTPVFERAKTVHALDWAATVIGVISYRDLKFIFTFTSFV
jgi:hypothetical protein